VTQLEQYEPATMVSPLSGNRLIPIGSKHLHCEPPADFCQQRTGREERKEALCNCACGSVLSSDNSSFILNVFCI
jgi:hypothetical protein